MVLLGQVLTLGQILFPIVKLFRLFSKQANCRIGLFIQLFQQFLYKNSLLPSLVTSSSTSTSTSMSISVLVYCVEKLYACKSSSVMVPNYNARFWSFFIVLLNSVKMSSFFSRSQPMFLKISYYLGDISLMMSSLRVL